jgi:hypothetical protein
MVNQKQNMAADVLEAVGRRRPPRERVAVGDPLTAEQILAVFEAKIEQRPDIGVLNRMLNIFFEPRNPFEPGKTRKPKMETVLFGMLLGVVIGAFLFFNLAAPKLQVYP